MMNAQAEARQSVTQPYPGLREQFREQGFVKVPGLFSADEVTQFRESIVEAGGLLEKPSHLDKDNMIFYTNVFAHSPALQMLTTQKKVIDLVCAIGGPDLWIRWDQCVAKAPGGAVFPWHQDNGYNQLKVEHYQFWIALSEMTVENGGLWLQPGSHKKLLPHEQIGNHMVCKVKVSDETFCAAEKGDVIVFSSLMLHHTKKNNSNSDRWAYVVEYMSLDHYDPLVPSPFFVVAENGVRNPHWVSTYRGHSRLSNRLKYVGLSLEDRAKGLLNTR